LDKSTFILLQALGNLDKQSILILCSVETISFITCLSLGESFEQSVPNSMIEERHAWTEIRSLVSLPFPDPSFKKSCSPQFPIKQ